MLQELESLASTFRRGFDNILEEPATTLIEICQETFKAGCSLALKFHISIPKAFAELITVLLSRITSEKDTKDAMVMMKNDDENKKEEFKIFSVLLERYVLHAAQIYKNIDFERIFTMQIRENDIPKIVMEIIIKIMEKYNMPKNKNARVQDFVKDIFENASMQNCIKNIFQITSMQDVQDFVKDIFENASMQDCIENILQNASMQDFFQNIFQNILQNASMLDVVKDIVVIIIDVLSIFNQRKDASTVQQITE